MEIVKKKKEKIIFVYLGKLPDYAHYSLKIATKFHHVIILVDQPISIECSNLEVVDIKSFYSKNNYLSWIENIRDKINLSTLYFREGFWFKTIERFFVLEAYLRKFDINEVFHGEIDNLFFDLNSIVEYTKKYDKLIYYPMQSKNNASGSIIYIKDHTGIQKFCEYIAGLDLYFSDMELLGLYAKNFSSSVGILPSEYGLSNREIQEGNQKKFIVDAAGIGQYLFGIDPRNTGKPLFNRFKNEHSGDLISKYKFSIASDFSSCKMFKNDLLIDVVNLHIHSKMHKKLFSSEEFLLKTVSRINMNKSTLIHINIRNLKYLRNILDFLTRLFYEKK